MDRFDGLIFFVVIPASILAIAAWPLCFCNEHARSARPKYFARVDDLRGLAQGSPSPSGAP